MLLRKKWFIFLLGMILVIVIAVATIIWKVNSAIDESTFNSESAIVTEKTGERIRQKQLQKQQQFTVETKKPEDFYMLLIGLDTRKGSYTLNTDTIIVAHIIPQLKKIKLVSLPRDLRVETLDNQVHKANFLFYEGYLHAVNETKKNPSLLSGNKVSIGGWHIPEEHVSSGVVQLRENIEHLFDIEIDYSILVHFETVISLVDAVGGVDIDVDRTMIYDDPTDGTHIRFEPGLTHMNGEQALNYARFRQDNRGPAYYSSDIERTQRQQQVISAIVSELSSWKNIGRIFDVLNTISDSFKTDMKKDELLRLVKNYYNMFNSESLETIPVQGYWQSPFIWVTPEEFEQVQAAFTSTDA